MQKTLICSICKKDVKIEFSSKYRHCNECGKDICEYCFVDPFCIDHYGGLSPEDTSKLKELIKMATVRRDRLKKWENRFFRLIGTISILLTVCLLWFIFSNRYFYTNLQSAALMMLIPIVFLFPPTYTLVFYESRRKKFFTQLEIEKEEIRLRSSYL